MDADRWRLVEDRFHEALAVPHERRAVFLDGIADKALRAELVTLLRASDAAECTFLERPARASRAAHWAELPTDNSR
jgi:hypothetical protein